jgi:excisionase family DNA binding protein
VKAKYSDPTVAGWLTTAGAAAYTASSEKTVLRGVKSGKLRHVRLAGNLRLRFRREWLDEWMLGDAQDTTSPVAAAGTDETRPVSGPLGADDRTNGRRRAAVVKVQ